MNFDFHGSRVRTTMINDEPYFVGKDIAEILGYRDTSDALKKHVDSEDKGVCEMPTPGGKQQMKVINESGLYSLILGSKLTTAKEFKRWVTSEVLPSIRKHGAYLEQDTLNRAISDPDFAIGLLTALKEEREMRKQIEEKNKIQEQQLLEMGPKVSYYDIILNCKDLVSVSKIAKDFGKSAVWLNKYLAEKKIQFKQGNIWLLYQKYARQGYTGTKTALYPGDDGSQHAKMSTYWTQKGRLFIYDTLKKDGILPLIEQQNERACYS